MNNNVLVLNNQYDFLYYASIWFLLGIGRIINDKQMLN